MESVTKRYRNVTAVTKRYSFVTETLQDFGGFQADLTHPQE